MAKPSRYRRKMKRSRGKRSKKGSGNFTNGSVKSSTQAYVKNKRYGKRSFKKKLSVSKGLRQKIKKVVAGTGPIGKYYKLGYENYIINQILSNRQFASRMFYAEDAQGGLFDFNQLLYNCNKMWNPNFINAAVRDPTTADVITANSFAWKTFKVDVLKWNYTQRFKNNGNRTLNIKVLYCKRKRNDQQKETATKDPYTYWQTAITSQSVATGVDANANILAGAYAGLPLPAIQYPDPTTLYTDPRMFAQWNSQFKVADEVSMVLEPGQTASHVVKGKTGMYSGSTRAYNGEYNPYDKNVVYPILIMWNDMIQVVSPVAGTPATWSIKDYGRLASPNEAPNAASNGCLIVESHSVFKCQVPAAVANTYTTSGVLQTAMVNKLVFDNYVTPQTVASTDNHVRVDQLNPMPQSNVVEG